MGDPDGGTPPEIDAGEPDAEPVPVIDYDSTEGGEVRLEYLQFKTTAATVNRARGTAFLFKGETAGFHPLPDVPGCTDFVNNPGTRWPVAQEAGREYLDVGQVIIAGGPSQLNLAAGAVPGVDNIQRSHTGPWRFSSLNNMGPNFVDPDTTYDVVFTGSSEWPPQVFEDVIYVPGAWTPTNPGIDVDPVLAADTPLTIEYTTPELVNRPEGYPITTLVIFTQGDPPLAICAEEDTDGSITIPAEIVNLVRAAAPGGGKFIRQHASHVVRELTDGEGQSGTRIDFIGIWCYNYAYTVAP
jgi:hypothetical protein